MILLARALVQRFVNSAEAFPSRQHPNNGRKHQYTAGKVSIKFISKTHIAQNKLNPKDSWR